MKGNHWLALLMIVSGILFFTACEDDQNNVGLDIQPPGDRLNVFTTDTFSVYAYSKPVDSVRTDETSVSLLGSIHDPIFGTTTASLYTQFRLSETAVSFGDNPVLDSLVMTLDYKSLYGDTNALLTMEVYEITEKFYPDSLYYSNMSLAHDPVLIATKTFMPHIKDSVIVDGDTVKPHFRINLSQTNPTLANKLISASSDDLNTQDDFQEYFYGLYLKFTDVSSGGAIFSTNLLSTWSEMTLFYSNDEEDSLVYPFIISTYAAYFGEFRHNYSLAQPAFRSQVLEGDTSLGKNTIYLQTMAGVKSFIKIPFLRDIENAGHIAINEARLFISAQEADPYLPPAGTLVLVRADGEGGYDFLPDDNVGDDYFGGYYNEDDDGYWFRITETVQDMLSGDDPDYGFELYISGGSVNHSRCILTGFDPPFPVPFDDRIRLSLTYTKLD